MKKIPLFALAAFAFTLSAVHSLEVNRDELSSTTDTVDFVNYTGPNDVINTIEEIRGIGSVLGEQMRQVPPDTAAQAGNARYRIIHAVDANETSGFDADIIVLGATAGVDHIDNLRRIISGYLSSAYGYATRDGDTLAFFITVYNAVHRGDMDFFQSRYKNVVTRELTAGSVGLARTYSEWPGRTQIVIPLSDQMFSGTLSTIDTTALVESDVIQSIREDEESARGIRTEMTELREREGDEAQDRADQARAEAAAAREEAARLAQEGDEARAMAEQARAEEALAQTEAERLAREADAAQRAAETASQEADEAATLAALNPADEEAQAAAEEAAAAAAAAEQRAREAERLAAESEAAHAQAQENVAEAEAREREAEALREQQEEAERRAAEAESRAEREQALADARQEETAQERREIASDTQEDLDREAARRAAEAEAERERELAEARRQEEEAAQRAAEAEAEREQQVADARQEEEAAQQAAEAESRTEREQQQAVPDARRQEDAAIAAGNAGAILRVVNPNGLLSEVVLVNTENGSPMRTSAINNIRNRTLLDTGDAYMAVAGQGSTARLVLIDKLTLDVTMESNDAVAGETVLVASGNDYYAVVSRGGAFCVARFDKNLNVQSTSSVQVQPYTVITVSDGRLLVQDTDSRIRVLRSTDLTDMASSGSETGIAR